MKRVNNLFWRRAIINRGSSADLACPSIRAALATSKQKQKRGSLLQAHYTSACLQTFLDATAKFSQHTHTQALYIRIYEREAERRIVGAECARRLTHTQRSRGRRRSAKDKGRNLPRIHDCCLFFFPSTQFSTNKKTSSIKLACVKNIIIFLYPLI